MEMLIQAAPLAATATALRTGKLDLLDYVDQACDRVEKLDVQIQALLPEPGRQSRLRQEALALQNRFPDPQNRPLLYGVLIGVKDIYRVDGFPTKAGSKLPPETFVGAEAVCVTRLKEQGALILGKTVTAEFAYIDPGPTRNPHNLEHTPGGSSSGSAAAVAAGFCSLALGTQTVGSAIRPAAYCGIVGFKPSYGRIPTDGIIPVSTALDHVGLFTQDVAGMTLAVSLVCQDWNPASLSAEPLPVLGIPVGLYLEQASPIALEALETGIQQLEKAGYLVKRIPAFDDIKTIAEHHVRLMKSEAAENHRIWFAQFESLYSPRIAGLIREGQMIGPEQRLAAQSLQKEKRAELEALMETNGIDLWLSPATTSPAPRGIESTGDSAMNLPWTFAGMPTITLPAGTTAAGLPLGLQFSGAFMADEQLLQWSEYLVEILALY
jgi:Asp-tRNA(Asn)/Glu-tRNA(Gln) amidotransferase A subunit family amidase